MNIYSKVFLRFSVLFALLGAFLGSHMAGSGAYEFKSVHAHILVVGWLSLFAWAMFYKLFTPKSKILPKIHCITGIIGSVGLTIGMWLYYVHPFGLPDLVSTLFFIIGGSILVIAFAAFALIAFLPMEEEK